MTGRALTLGTFGNLNHGAGRALALGTLGEVVLAEIVEVDDEGRETGGFLRSQLRNHEQWREIQDEDEFLAVLLAEHTFGE